MLIEKFLKQAKEEIIMDTVLSDEFMDKVQDNFAPIESLMAYYRCAIMEVETKFNVLNEQFSLQYDRNPIESIKTRVKSFDSILKKVKRKQIPFSLESIEENINDMRPPPFSHSVPVPPEEGSAARWPPGRGSRRRRRPDHLPSG